MANSKRPARGSLAQFAELPEAAPPASAATVRAKLADAAPAGAARDPKERQAITVRLFPAELKRLTILGVELGMTTQELAVAGLNLVFEHYGQAPLDPSIAPKKLAE